MVYQKASVGAYGTWEALDGCTILPGGVGTFPPLADTFLEDVFSVKYVQPIFVIWSEHGFCKSRHIVTCIGQTPLPKWPYGMWEEITCSGQIIILLEKCYHNNPSGWFSNVLSYLVIEFFHKRWFNDYLLWVFHFWFLLISWYIPSPLPPIHP